MVQRRKSLGFSFKAAECATAVGWRIANELYGHLATQPDVLRHVNHAHAATAQRRHNAIVANHSPHDRLLFLPDEQIGRNLQCGGFDEDLRLSVMSEQRFHFLAQLPITFAGSLQERGALARLQSGRGVVELLDLAPLFRLHINHFG